MYPPLEADFLYRQTEQQWEQTLPVCTLPLFYYNYHEETELRFLPYNRFYRCHIDNALIIVDENAPYEYLKNNMNNFGPIEKRLTWNTEQLSNLVDFLDLTLAIQEDGTTTYKIYQTR